MADHYVDVSCPLCGCLNCRVREPGALLGDGEGTWSPIVFVGACGHEWELHIEHRRPA